MKFKRPLAICLLVLSLIMGTISVTTFVDLAKSKSDKLFIHPIRPVEMKLPDLVDQVIPGVVHVRNVGICQGSGFIIGSGSIVVTAKHVVEGGDNFVVTLNDGREYETKYVVEDEKYDVAFLLIDHYDPNISCSMSDIDSRRVGDSVFICGSPYGYDNFNSVSKGIISGIQRDLDAERDYGYGWSITFQTDSAANPGNSGGPVFNMEGKVIGVLVAGMSEGVNYAVPVEVFMDKLLVIQILLEMQRFDERMEVEYYDYYDEYSYEHSWSP